MPLLAPPAARDETLVPARTINEWLYCPRLAFLEWAQGEWAGSADVAAGKRAHRASDKGRAPALPAPDALEEKPFKTRRLALEAEDGLVVPVDTKVGKRPHVADARISSGFWFLGATGGQGPRSAATRTAQYAAAADPARRLAFARELVAVKIRNQRTLLRRNWRGEAEKRAAPLDALTGLADRALLAADTSLLHGFEGEAAAIYFRNLPNLFTPAVNTLPNFAFERRNRRPPADPVNACLSRGYALLTRSVTASLTTVGLDPWKGFYHVERPGRPALALDFLEPFRPLLADSAVLTALDNYRPAISSMAPAAAISRPRAGGRWSKPMSVGSIRRPPIPCSAISSRCAGCMLKSKSVGKLGAWLRDAQKLGLYAMQRFDRTAQRDIDAVRNAITEPWSNGQTEGQINRLKALKRTMYGRAGPELLRARACFLCSGHRNRK